MYPQRHAQLFTNTISVGAPVCFDVCTGSLGTEARGDSQDIGPDEDASWAHRTGRSSWYSPTWSPSWRALRAVLRFRSRLMHAYSCFNCLRTISDTSCLSDRLFATYTSPCTHAVATQCDQSYITCIVSVATASKPAGDCDNTDVWGVVHPCPDAVRWWC